MSAELLRALQLQDTYREEPEAATLLVRANGRIGPNVTCRVQTSHALIDAGLHPTTGGGRDGIFPGSMLLEALVACVGVTLNAIATAQGVELEHASIHAEGELDVRGTLGVAKGVPVGFKAIRLQIELDTAASDSEIAMLLRLTQRFCVVGQSLATPPLIEVRRKSASRLMSMAMAELGERIRGDQSWVAQK